MGRDQPGKGRLITTARFELIAAIASAEHSVRLASPFLSRRAASLVARAASGSDLADRRLLTALDQMSVRTGVLDPKGLRDLANAGFAVATIPNLHAKVALVDGGWGLVAGDRRWPHVTETSCVYEVPIETAPRPASFGIDARSTQPGYRGLTRDVFERAIRAMAWSANRVSLVN